MKRPIIEKNFKSDFDFLLKLKDKKGNQIGFPDYDFVGRIFSCHDRHNPFERERVYEFSRRGDRLKNCFNDDGRLHIIMCNHHLGPGRLHLDLDSFLPNPMYEEGVKKVQDKLCLSIELVDGPGDHDFFIEDEEVTLDYVFYTAFELAKAGGFDGSEEDFNEALSQIGEINDRVKSHSLDITRLKCSVKNIAKEVNCQSKNQEKIVQDVKNSIDHLRDLICQETKRAKQKETDLEDSIGLLSDKQNKDVRKLADAINQEAGRAGDAERALQKALDEISADQENLAISFKSLKNYVTDGLKRVGDDIYDEIKRAKGKEDDIISHVKKLKRNLIQLDENLKDEAKQREDNDKDLIDKIKKVKDKVEAIGPVDLPTIRSWFPKK